VIEPGEAFDNGQPDEVSEYAYTCGAVCGDGVVQSGEDCDDGNDSNADACPTTCKPHRCGDGIARGDLVEGVAGFEACDDGNQDSLDGCDTLCERCGDGIVGFLEGCDDGNDVAEDGCTNCALPTCGNGRLDEGEACDGQNCLRCVAGASPEIASYSLSPDNEDGANIMLTDGIGPASPDANYVGWQNQLPVVITLDLGRPTHWQSVDLYGVEGLYGWVFPLLTMSSSNDGIDWASISSERIHERLSTHQSPSQYFSRLEGRAQYPAISRYIRLTFDCANRDHCPYFRTSEVIVRR
jgi:cysteine-rich repeat protein